MMTLKADIHFPSYTPNHYRIHNTQPYMLTSRTITFHNKPEPQKDSFPLRTGMWHRKALWGGDGLNGTLS